MVCSRKPHCELCALVHLVRIPISFKFSLLERGVLTKPAKFAKFTKKTAWPLSKISQYADWQTAPVIPARQ
jgi:hypothetical protein